MTKAAAMTIAMAIIPPLSPFTRIGDIEAGKYRQASHHEGHLDKDRIHPQLPVLVP
jgi:hypothetical protein